MLKNFYTNIALRGNTLLVRSVEDNHRVSFRDDSFQPEFYVNSKNKNSKFRTLDDKIVDSVLPGTINECRNFIEKYKDVAGFNIYGNEGFVYQYISEHWQDTIDYDFSLLKICNVDIETECENGFPDVDNPQEKVNVITWKQNGHYRVYGTEDLEFEQDNLEYFYCLDEKQLLDSFISDWMSNFPDIITGWNCKYFDIPYLFKRSEKILGKERAKNFSPWGVVKAKKTVIMNREQSSYDFLGISILDYLDLYKKFTYTTQESYKLNQIAFVELDEKKLDYSEYENIREFYKQDYKKFVDYNIKDVELVDKLENKLKLLELGVSIAYSAKVNFDDIFSPVKLWDTLIYNRLREKDIVIPMKEHFEKNDMIAGAYVKDPLRGMHDWTVTFDAASLYPHIMMELCLSPETTTEYYRDVTVDQLLEKKIDTSWLKDENLCMGANGYCFKRQPSLMGNMMDEMFANRTIAKKQMLADKAELEKVETELKSRGIKF